MSAAFDLRENFLTAIRETGDSPAEVCRQLGVSREGYRKWTNHECDPSAETLARAREKYGAAFISRVFALPSPDQTMAQWHDMLGQMRARLSDGGSNG